MAALTVRTRPLRILYPSQRPFDIQTDRAGPLLDAVIAAEVLLRAVCLDDPEDPRYLNPRGREFGHRVPPLSTSNKAVILVERRLAAACCEVQAVARPDGSWCCTILPPLVFRTGPVTRVATTRPLAVCLAARAVMRPHEGVIDLEDEW